MEQINAGNVVKCKFGIGSASSIGTSPYGFPIKYVVMKVNMHIIDADVPLLLSFADMDKHRIRLDNLKSKLYHEESAALAVITRHHGHPFRQWNAHTE